MFDEGSPPVSPSRGIFPSVERSSTPLECPLEGTTGVKSIPKTTTRKRNGQKVKKLIFSFQTNRIVKRYRFSRFPTECFVRLARLANSNAGSINSCLPPPRTLPPCSECQSKGLTLTSRYIMSSTHKLAYCLHLSPDCLSDLLKKEAGKTA